MYGVDYPYAQTRIQGTIVRLKESNEPVFIHGVQFDGTCLYSKLTVNIYDDENMERTHIDNLNLRPVPLGYVNCAGEATYLMRMPLRRDWKQGLRQENCYSAGRRLNEIPYKDLRNCILGKYPTFKKALNDVSVGVAKGRIKTIAWHRHWALNSRGLVFYKAHEIVGEVSGDSGKVELLACNKYLNEALQESM